MSLDFDVVHGLIVRRVLKHTIFLQFLEIEAAQGVDRAADIVIRQGKLDNNVAIDEGNAGKASKGVA